MGNYCVLLPTEPAVSGRYKFACLLQYELKNCGQEQTFPSDLPEDSDYPSTLKAQLLTK